MPALYIIMGAVLCQDQLVSVSHFFLQKLNFNFHHLIDVPRVSQLSSVNCSLQQFFFQNLELTCNPLTVCAFTQVDKALSLQGLVHPHRAVTQGQMRLSFTDTLRNISPNPSPRKYLTVIACAMMIHSTPKFQYFLNNWRCAFS